MAISLVLRLLVFPLGSFAFFYALFSLRAPYPTFVFGTPEAFWPAMIAGAFLWLALNKWLLIRRMRAELETARKFRLEDGKRTVVSGRLKAKDAPLESPCSGKRCVAYRYQVAHSANTGTIGDSAGRRLMIDFRGYAMTPTVIQGAAKSVALLAEPEQIELLILKPGVNALNGEIIEGEAARDRVRRYLGEIDFGDESNARINAGREAMEKESYLAAGNFRKDTKAKDAKTITPDSIVFETLIEERETFLVSGIYSAEKNGIGPGANSTLEPLRLVQGGDAAQKAAIAGKRKTVMVGLGLATLTAAAHFAGLL